LWQEGVIVQKSLSDSKFLLTVALDDDVKKEFSVPANDDDEVDDLKLRNVGNQAGVKEGKDLEDLTQLTHLHEPAILYSLFKRYEAKTIYTYTGPVLLAVNPFERLPLYTDKILNQYRVDGEKRQYDPSFVETLPPHVYALADKSYRNMMDSTSEYGVRSQSILVSGESGAGKTETCKIIMKYVAILGNASGDASHLGAIEIQVLQSNPILEAFGNARTVRNDNSSRFGKYIQMLFSETGKLHGANIKTFLLEKVRVVKQSLLERNYHIFYAMKAGASDKQIEHWNLKDPKDYYFTNQSNCYDRRDGVSDDKVFKELTQAFETMDFTENQIMGCFDVVASVLALGNIKFEDTKSSEEDQPKCKIAKGSDTFLETAARLLGSDEETITEALTTRHVTAGINYQVTIYQNSEQSSIARDALAKAIYAAMFEWVVKRVNASMDRNSHNDSMENGDFNTDLPFIGLLDIFGFEIFKENYFEQFLINYANEMLQQQFNDFVFRQEQEEYGVEQIEWTFVEFPDNKDCIHLIEGKPNGIIPTLDEQCLIGQSTDERFARELYKKCHDNPRMLVTNKMRVDHKFQIRHYAGDVTYTTAGMIEKNRDALAQEGVDLLLGSINPFVVLMGEIESSAPTSQAKSGGRAMLKKSVSIKRVPSRVTGGRTQGGGPRRSMIGAKSLGTQFKNSLASLVRVISNTYPHYVRCIKPNDTLVPKDYNHTRIAEQLRNAGVLEVVRVARAGFPVRLGVSEFIQRYGLLSSQVVADAYRQSSRQNEREQERYVCQELIKSVLMLANNGNVVSDFNELCRENGLQMGLTKVFFQQKAFNKVEKLRTVATVTAALVIQTAWRRYVLRLKYLILMGVIKKPEPRPHQSLEAAALRIQNISRAFLAKRAQEASFKAELNMQKDMYEDKINSLIAEISALKTECEALKSRPARFVVVASPLAPNIEASRVTEAVHGAIVNLQGSSSGDARTIFFDG